MNFSSHSSQRNEAFTRIDLAVALASTLLLLAILLAKAAPAAAQSDSAVCRANLNSLIQAWTAFATDHSGRFVPNEDNQVGGWVKGWLTYSGSSDNTNTLYLTNATSGARLGDYVPGSHVYKCPSDLSRSTGTTGEPRVRSYSMSAAVGPAAHATDPYMGRGGWLPRPPYRVYVQLSDLTNPKPANLWVFVDEHPDSINDGSFAVQMPGASGGRWIDFPAAHHEGAGTLAFADGHVELHTWQAPSSIPPLTYSAHSGPGAYGQNPDVFWVGERTSALTSP